MSKNVFTNPMNFSNLVRTCQRLTLISCFETSSIARVPWFPNIDLTLALLAKNVPIILFAFSPLRQKQHTTMDRAPCHSLSYLSSVRKCKLICTDTSPAHYTVLIDANLLLQDEFLGATSGGSDQSNGAELTDVCSNLLREEAPRYLDASSCRLARRGLRAAYSPPSPTWMTHSATTYLYQTKPFRFRLQFYKDRSIDIVSLQWRSTSSVLYCRAGSRKLMHRFFNEIETTSGVLIFKVTFGADTTFL